MCAFLKTATPLRASISWAEVVFGPAITVGLALLLLIAGSWIEHVFRRSGTD